MMRDGPAVGPAVEAHPSTPFAMRFSAERPDIDELGHVNNAVYVRWLQEIAGAHWHALATAEEAARWLWVVVRHEIDYRQQTKLGETLTAETWVAQPRGARFDRHVRFVGADGVTRVEAVATWATVDRASGGIARVPAELAAHFLAA